MVIHVHHWNVSRFLGIAVGLAVAVLVLRLDGCLTGFLRLLPLITRRPLRFSGRGHRSLNLDRFFKI